MKWKKWIEKIRMVLYPRRCACCSRVIPAEKELCAFCEARLPRLPEPVCRRCGQARAECLCSHGPRPLYWDGFCAPFYYRDVAAQGIRQMKFRGRADGAVFFAGEMAQTLRRVFPKENLDAVCYVPMTKRKQRERGYNQAALLAKHLAEELQLPLLHSLVKTRDNRIQHKLKFPERQENVRGIYACRESLTGKRILLVDDIKTTGFTLNACAEALKAAGARRVVCTAAGIVLPKAL